MPSIEPWNRPGDRGEPTSAMTVTLMSVGVTPTSLASNVLPLQASAALLPVDDVAPRPSSPLLPLLRQAAKASADATANASHPDRFTVPPQQHASGALLRLPVNVTHRQISA